MDFGARDLFWRAFRTGRVVPPVDILEDEKTLSFQVDLPGLSANDINIEVNAGSLTISGERCLKSDRAIRFHRFECRYGRFSRSFVLPESVDAEAARAEFNNGVLSITLLKKAEAVEHVSHIAFGENLEQMEGPQEERADPNYEAYVRDAADLERNYPGHIVAYANGKRVAEAENAQELAQRIPESYRNQALLIKDIPAKPVKFQRPLRFSQE